MTRQKTKLRAWQNKALASALTWFTDKSNGNKPFLIEAVTGAGKTTAGVEIAAALLLEGTVSRVIVLAPSVEIAEGWAGKFTKLGLNATTDLIHKDSSSAESTDIVSVCVTYMGSNGLISDAKTMVILDEIHHAEREESWGKRATLLAEQAGKVLCLTGTPWMTSGTMALLDKFYVESDGGKRIELKNRKDGYSYSYREDLSNTNEDRATVAVGFKYHESDTFVTVTKKGEKPKSYRSHLRKFDNDLERDEIIANGNMDEALSSHVHIDDAKLSNNAMAKSMIAAAIAELDAMKEPTKNRAIGLVACKTVKEAGYVKDYLIEECGCSAEKISSDDERSAKRLRSIVSGKEKNPPEWIVSVGMVSEGVDIPEIKVIVFLSNILTLLYLVQLVGRALRRIAKSRDDASLGYLDSNMFHTKAVVFMPAHPKLIKFGTEIENIVSQVYAERIKPPGGDGEKRDDIIKTSENSGGASSSEVLRGSIIPSDITEKLLLLLRDKQAREIIDENFKAWINNLCAAKKFDEARRILQEYIDKFDIHVAPDAAEDDESESYDEKTRRLKREIEKYINLIRFTERYRGELDEDAYRKVRVDICNLAFKRFKSVNDMNLNEKEFFVQVAKQYHFELIMGQDAA